MSVLARIGNFFFRWRNTLFPFACLLVLLPDRHVFDDPLYAGALGFTVALLGQAVRCLTIGFEYVIRGGRNKQVYAEQLVTEGVYRLSRNPMYVGNLAILLGLAIATNSWTCLVVVPPAFLFVYVAIVAAEEHYLRRKFGEAFDRYCADVPRWLPSAAQVAAHGFSGRFRWKRVLVKEYGTPVGWISMLMAVLLWQLADAKLLEERAEEVTALLVLFAALLVAYLRVRSLKLSRRLVAD